MSAAERTHVPAPEEVMAYLDGEVTGMSRTEIEAHLAGCETCRAVADNLRGVSARTQAWSAGAAPGSLRAPDVPRRSRLAIPFVSWRPSGAALATVGLAAVVVFGVFLTPVTKNRAARVAAQPVMLPDASASRRSGGGGGHPGAIAGRLPEVTPNRPPLATPPPPAPAAPALTSDTFAQAPPAAPPRGPMVIRTATLRIIVKEFGSVRPTVEAVVSQFGGFVDRLSVDADTATARSLTGSLRVPADRISAALDRLRQLGQVVEDGQGSEDVTDQIVDLDARLASARATEQRLTDLLKNRTGRLSDVLSVERELARVRLEIERLDAEKTNTTRRVTYATITIQISEERKQGLETGALPLSTRIRVAAADGVAAAIESLVGIGLFILRAGPSLLIWGIVAVVGWVALRRTLARRGRTAGATPR
jgi:uncharacterized protein DUF4349/putative zinc finger protein